MEAKIIPDGSVLSRVWSPELAALLADWERAVEASARVAVADASHESVLEVHALRVEAARVAFVVRLSAEMLGIAVSDWTNIG